MFGGRQVKTHGQLMRDELSEGFGHLWQAAAHAASGVGATVGPKWDSARERLPRAGRMRDAAAHGLDSTVAAFVPLMDAARTGAADATRKAQQARSKARKRESARTRKRATMLVGLLTAGVAAGAAGAVMAKRRNRNRWEEYESRAINAMPGGGTARSTVDKGAHRAASAAEAVGETADVFAEQTEQTKQAAARTDEAAEQGKARTDQYPEKAHTVSKNSRG